MSVFPTPPPVPDSIPHPASVRLPWLRETPYWLIAVAAHVVLLLLLGTVVMFEIAEEGREPMTIIRRQFDPPEYDPRDRRRLLERPEVLAERTERTTPTVDPVQRPTTPEPRPTRQPASLREFGTASSPAPSGFGEVGRHRTPIGGGERSESAVTAALEWLRRHQHPDGHWSSQSFHAACAPGAGCTFAEGVQGFGADDAGFSGFDVGVTGLALLAFVGRGHTHVGSAVPRYREVVRRATVWLLAQQLRSSDASLDGLIGAPIEGLDEWIYNHAIATMALGDLLLLSRDRLRLARPVESAARWCLRARTPGYGWKYEYQGSRSDTSVTGWMVLALKSVRASSAGRSLRLRPEEFEEAFAGVRSWIEVATSRSNGRTGYESPGDPGSRLLRVYGEDYPFSKDLSCMTAVAILCRIFSGESKQSDAVRRGVAHLADHPPRWHGATARRRSGINLYSWYYASYALFQVGGRTWREWNDSMQEALIDHQRVGGCSDGSWDPIGEWGIAGGRVYATAMGALTLEVYYRAAND